MSELPIDELTRRVEQLERENRRLKRTGATILIGVAALFLMGHGEPAKKLIQGDQIALRTPGAPIRGELSVQGDGGAHFVLYDTNRTPRLELAAAASGGAPALTLYDSHQSPRAWLRLDDDGTPHLELYGPTGQKVWSAP